jgi:hypothetical protein
LRTQVTLLAGQAAYHYTFGAQEAGRACYDRAETLLRAGPADDITGNQLAMVLADRAVGEYGVEDYGEAARVYTLAWEQCQNLHAQWRRAGASQYLASKLAPTFGRTLEELGEAGLPNDLVAYETAYQRAHNPDSGAAGRLPVSPPGLASWPVPDPSLEPAVARGSASRIVSTDVADTLQPEVGERFGDDPDPALLEQAASALFNKGLALCQLGRSEEGTKVFGEVVARFGEAPESALREQTATALSNKGFMLGQLGRFEEAAGACDEVVARFGDAPESALRELVAKALVSKCVALSRLGRFEEAAGACDEAVARIGDDLEPTLLEQAAVAQRMRAEIEGSTRNYS